eukprot:CAMPEP_0183722962 /NCGR_PEP_ID=MMETSP0737-20130205/14744_1 /TAXON_ID=385413 /ORGANISM="Thalassiosira miniscula, Strain CCMP1093" /LENGTH=856 /DNA_ID=CAMNT_0025953209 /DNA_START=96 /DNA_END=2666 /DNA_ORIENTATION=-
MNSRPDDHELSSSTPRLSARSRFAPSPILTASPSYDYGNNDNYRAVKSKGGINGRGNALESDEEEELGSLSSRSALRSASKKRLSSSSSSNAANAALTDVAQDFRLARTRSGGSTASSRSSRDRPWQKASSNSSSIATNATSGTSGYATANNHYNEEEEAELSDGGDNGSSSSGIEVTASRSQRWSQYETDDLEEESRRATSNAVVDMATRMAQRQVEEEEEEQEEQEEEEEQEPMIASQPIMGGKVGSGLGSGSEILDDLDNLERNGNSLPPRMPSEAASSRSTTEYVKSRLSALVSQRNSTDYERTLSTSSTQSDHDKVRNEALKMLQIADECLLDSPRSSTSGRQTSPSSPKSYSGNTTGLFRTRGGGLAMRELHDDEVSNITTKREKASIAGLDKFAGREKSTVGGFDGTFTIGSHDEEDLKKFNSNGTPVSPNDEAPTSSWSSRYSVERQLMAITGGLDSTRMLAKMDMLHSSREKTKSARGMYRASGYAMDGSHEDYNDYTKTSSTGVGLGGIWMWLRGTLWSDGLELNYDGTTQSLVRREKIMQRRRRFRWATMFFIGLSIAVGVLVHLINNAPSKSAMKLGAGDVDFYVLADEPYDFSNVEQLTRDLEALPSDAEFIVHLGNANGDSQSQCQEYGFERAAAVLKESPVPVLVIPGDLDWAACGSKRAAERSLGYWDVNLGRLEKNWDHSLDIDYSDDVIGNFAFLHKGVLFISVSIVDAKTNPEEVTMRLEQNVLWTKEKLNEFDPKEYHAVVIFGHAPPSEKQGEYFWPVRERVSELEKPVLYVHANSNGSFQKYVPFREAENFQAVQLEKRGREAPLRVGVLNNAEDQEEPFVFERREPAMARMEK